MIFLLLGIGIFLYIAWVMILSFHSPVTPHLPTGHTEEVFLGGRGPAPVIYTTKTESYITLSILWLAVAMPAAYWSWQRIRRLWAR